MSFLTTEYKDNIINLDSVEAIRIGQDLISIKVDFKSGRGCQLIKYKNEQDCRKALATIVNNISKGASMVIIESPKSEYISDFERYHGKKTIRRGNS